MNYKKYLFITLRILIVLFLVYTIYSLYFYLIFLDFFYNPKDMSDLLSEFTLKYTSLYLTVLGGLVCYVLYRSKIKSLKNFAKVFFVSILCAFLFNASEQEFSLIIKKQNVVGYIEADADSSIIIPITERNYQEIKSIIESANLTVDDVKKINSFLTNNSLEEINKRIKEDEIFNKLLEGYILESDYNSELITLSQKDVDIISINLRSFLSVGKPLSVEFLTANDISTANFYNNAEKLPLNAYYESEGGDIYHVIKLIMPVKYLFLASSIFISLLYILCPSKYIRQLLIACPIIFIGLFLSDAFYPVLKQLNLFVVYYNLSESASFITLSSVLWNEFWIKSINSIICFFFYLVALVLGRFKG